MAFPKDQLANWIVKRPVLGRLALFGLLLVFPVVFTAAVVWEARAEFVDTTKDIIRATFTRWS